MTKIERLQLGSSVRLNAGKPSDSEFMGFDTRRDPVTITFDKGVFTVTHLKSGDQVCFATTNVKYWKAANEPTELSDAPAHEQIEAASKKRGRPAKQET